MASASQGSDPSHSLGFIPTIPITALESSSGLQAQVQYLLCWGGFASGCLAQKLAFVSQAACFHLSMQFLSVLLHMFDST